MIYSTLTTSKAAFFFKSTENLLTTKINILDLLYRRISKSGLSIITLILLFFISSAQAWHVSGHVITATVAYKNVDPALLGQLNELAKVDMEEYPKSNNFNTVGVWADDIKVHGLSFYNDWHYDSTFFTLDNYPLPELKKSGQAYAMLRKNLYLLRSSKTTNHEKAFALRFVVHLASDLHQPLHNASLVSEQFPKGDMGGNLFLINDGYKKLHALWDSILKSVPELKRPLDQKSKEWLDSYTEALMAEYPKPSFTDAIIAADLNNWKAEAMEIIKTRAYSGIEYKGKPSESYLKDNLPILRKQLVLSGYRLANLLNCALGSSKCVETAGLDLSTDILA